MIISISATVAIDDCGNFPNNISAIINVKPPNGLLAKQIIDGKVHGINVVTKYVYFECEMCNQIHYPDIQINEISYIHGDVDIIIENEHDDFENTVKNELQEIKLTMDSHWDCYCKTRKVCGCGCDPLHDGW